MRQKGNLAPQSLPCPLSPGFLSHWAVGPVFPLLLFFFSFCYQININLAAFHIPSWFHLQLNLLNSIPSGLGNVSILPLGSCSHFFLPWPYLLHLSSVRRFLLIHAGCLLHLLGFLHITVAAPWRSTTYQVLWLACKSKKEISSVGLEARDKMSDGTCVQKNLSLGF